MNYFAAVPITMRIYKFKCQNRQQCYKPYERKLMSNRKIQIQIFSLSLSESVSVSLPYEICSVSTLSQWEDLLHLLYSPTV